jgi:hypothetical protein
MLEAVVLPAVCSQDSAPRIRFPKTSHDFGVVLPGSSKTYRFKVLNEGNAPLELYEAGGS